MHSSFQKPTLVLAIVLATTPCRSAELTPPFGTDEVRVQGIINVRDDQLELRDCSGKQRYLLRTHNRKLAHVLEQFAYTPDLFADLEGTVATTRNRDFPDFETTRIHRINGEGFACNDPDFPRLLYRASGNEPFWNIRAYSNRMTLRLRDGQTLTLPYVEERIGERQRTLIAADIGHRIELTLVSKACQDDMSGAHMSLTAALRLPDHAETLHGCAAPGALRNE